MPSSNTQTFEEQVLAAFRDLRTALVEVFESAQVDVNRAFPAARKLQVNKNLTWKASKIIRATSPLEAIEHLPGKAGMKLLLDALANHGASVQTIRRTESAVLDFDRVIEAHASDRETLELMLDGLTDGEDDSDALEKSRRLAFLGNSGVWGIQTRTRLTTYVMSPSASHPDLFDLSFVMGYVELKRLRSDAPWTLTSISSYQGDLEKSQKPRSLPMDPTAIERWGAPVLPAFCKPQAPQLQLRETPGRVAVDLPEGPVGNLGLTDIFIGQVDPHYASLFADKANRMGQFLMSFAMPIRQTQIDILVHKDLPPIENLDYKFVGRTLDEKGMLPPSAERYAMPLKPDVVARGRGAHAIQSAHYERYDELIAKIAQQHGCNAIDYDVYRVEIDYPPMGTTGVFSFPLNDSRIDPAER